MKSGELRLLYRKLSPTSVGLSQQIVSSGLEATPSEVKRGMDAFAPPPNNVATYPRRPKNFVLQDVDRRQQARNGLLSRVVMTAPSLETATKQDGY